MSLEEIALYFRCVAGSDGQRNLEALFDLIHVRYLNSAN
jgi:hypothetical protein